VSGSLGDFRLKLATPVTNARLAQRIARITGQQLSHVSHIMRECPGDVVFAFRLWGTRAEDKTDQIEQVLAAFAAEGIEPVLEEWMDGWQPLKLDVLRNIMATGRQIAAETRLQMDRELGAENEEPST